MALFAEEGPPVSLISEEELGALLPHCADLGCRPLDLQSALDGSGRGDGIDTGSASPATTPDTSLAASRFLLDPFHAAMRAGRRGCLTLEDVMPPGFADSAYFEYAYTTPGLVDEIAHVTSLDDGRVVITGAVRSRDQGRFDEREIARHRAAGPLVDIFAARIGRDAASARSYLPSAAGDIEMALERFGADLLTPREHENVLLVLRGYDTRASAACLQISRETVRLHRKRAYAKLRVSSQGELFCKFLESIGVVESS